MSKNRAAKQRFANGEKMNTRKIEGCFWLIVCLTFILIAILHPRVIYLFMFIVCAIVSIVCFKSKSTKPPRTISSLCIKMLGNLLAIIFVCYLGQMLNVFFPYHATYEYKNDIASLKMEREEKFYFFPQQIPESASRVEWVCSPGMMQGSAYQTLFFEVEDRYLQEMIDTYGKEATIYKWDGQYDWVNDDLERDILLGECKNRIASEDRKNVTVYVLYDNLETDNVHNGGFYINEPNGYICFWAQ